MEDILANMVKCIDSEAEAQTRADNIGANVGEDIRAVLTAIYRDAEPALADISPDLLNTVLIPTRDKFQQTTLLNEAVRQSNHRWTKALLAAGADPNAVGSLMAYTASDDIFHPKTQWSHLFQDGSPAVPFLALYLEHGGDLNTTASGSVGDKSLIEAPFRNLAAQVFLLEQGADPWLIARAPRADNIQLTMFGKLMFGSRAADFNERMYVFVTRGLFKPPQSEAYQGAMHDRYLRSLEDLGDATGPERRHKLWTLQKVLGALIDGGHIVPSARMTQILQSNPVPDVEGGWVLQQGAMHQPHGDPRRGGILGTEVW